MTTQRRDRASFTGARPVRPEVGTGILVLRILCGAVVPAALLLAFGLAVWDGDVFIEGGRRFGPINAYHLHGLGCALFALFGLLLSVGVALRGWTIGCKSDACRDVNHYALLVGAGAAFMGALLADAFLKGG